MDPTGDVTADRTSDAADERLPRARTGPLAGKRALVTGAGHRVGAAIARELAGAGADLVIHYHRSREPAEALCVELSRRGGKATALGADLGDANAAARLVDDTIATLGGLDLLVASAASYEARPFADISSEDFDRDLALNVRAPFMLAQRASTALRTSRGSNVLITCTSPRAPYPGYAPYIVSKGAAHTLMRVLAVELAPEVRVNAVAPGTVLLPPNLAREVVDQLEQATPLQRIGTAEDVASAVLYLATAPFVTGVEIAVDGGRVLTRGIVG